MKSTNVPTWGDKPPTRCVWCLKPAWASTEETCRSCRGIEAYTRLKVTDAHALTGGQWVRRGLVLVWDGPRDVDREPTPERRRPRAECGTESGYRRHQRLKERTCADCRAAKAAGERARKQQRRTAA